MADKKKGSALGTLLKLGVGFIALVAIVFFGGAFVLPSEFAYEKSITIKADQDDVHELVGDFRKWDEWGPWKEDDPSIASTYSEKTNEVGSWHEWTGKYPKKGRMEFTRCDSGGIAYKMTMDDGEPSTGSITYSEAEDGTKVTWKWSGSGSWPFERWMHNVGSFVIDKMFDKGLTKMKSKAEAKK